MVKPLTRRLAAGIGATALALACAACGSSGSGSSKTSSSTISSSTTSSAQTSGDAGSAVSAAKASVAKLTNPPAFTVPPISGKIPTGKRIAVVDCTFVQCNPNQMEEPSKALGWTVKEYPFDVTKGAQEYLKQVNAALASKPDYLAIALNYGPDVVAKQLQQAKSEGIPVIGIAGVDMTNIDLMINSPVALSTGGKYMADVAVADAGGPVHAASLIDPSQVGITAIANGSKKELAKVPGATADNINLSFAQPQPTNVSTTMNYLKSHPETNYLLFPGSAFYAGLHQALIAAGLQNKVKLVLGYPAAAGADIANIKSGEFIAGVSGESESEMWRGVDAMARLSAGKSVGDKVPAGSFRLQTKDNASATLTDPLNFKAAYQKAWGV